MFRLVFLLALCAAMPATSEPASPRAEAQTRGSPGQPAAIGGYTQGCLSGGVKLLDDGPNWAVMRPARNRSWAHPRMAEFIAMLSRRATAVGVPGLLIGDIGLARGGPFTSGHRSHQIGLDVDIWMRPMKIRPAHERRNTMSSFDVVEGRKTLNTVLWDRSSAPAIRVAAELSQVQRIFVNPVIKRALCDATAPEDRAWLSKVRPWWGHDAHFHVRLHCPPGSPDCTPQDAPASTDGCGAELDWWFTDEPYSGTSTPRKRLQMADLPKDCRAILSED